MRDARLKFFEIEVSISKCDGAGSTSIQSFANEGVMNSQIFSLGFLLRVRWVDKETFVLGRFHPKFRTPLSLIDIVSLSSSRNDQI